MEKAVAAILTRELAWDLAFDSFDKSGAGRITRAEATEMVKYWKLGLTAFELADIFRPMISREGRAEVITREVFNEKLVNSISAFKDYVLIKIKQGLLFDIHEKLLVEQGRTGITLKSLFEQFDYKKNGTADAEVISQILSMIHVKELTKRETELLLEAGGADPQCTTLVYSTFSPAMELAIQQEIQRRDQIYARVVRDLFSTLRTKKMSVFDAYCQFDMLQRDGIGKLELVACLQGLGVKLSSEDANVVWSTVMNGSGCEERLSYQGFLWMFARTGELKLSGPEAGVEGVRERFISSLVECKEDAKSLYTRIDKNLGRSVGKAEFIGTCKGAGIAMTEEELGKIFDVAKVDDVQGMTFRSLSDFVKAGERDEEDLIRIFTKIGRATQRRKIDWEKAFRLERDGRSQSREPRKVLERGLPARALANCIRKQQLGLGLDDIEAAVGKLAYSRGSGLIAWEEFLHQVQVWTQKRLSTKKVDMSSKLKSYISRVNEAIKRLEIGVEQAFADVDRDKDGALTLAEHNDLLLKLGVEMTKAAATEVFMAVSEGQRLTLDCLKKYLGNADGQIKTETGEEVGEGIGVDKEEEDRETLYYKIRERLVERETSINALLLRLKIDPLNQINIQGIRRLFESVELALTAKELGIIDTEVKRAFGKAEYSYQDLLDFMVRKRIDMSELYAGMLHCEV